MGLITGPAGIAKTATLARTAKKQGKTNSVFAIVADFAIFAIDRDD
jgi:hypothetical protein